MNLNFVKYKYRFFIGYIIIGIFSLVVEFIIYNALFSFQKNQILNSFFSVIIGVLLSLMRLITLKFQNQNKQSVILFYFNFFFFICSTDFFNK